MRRKLLFAALIAFFTNVAQAQQIDRFTADTMMTVTIDSAININSHKLTAQDFIDAVLADTSFYEAFRNMKRYTFIAENQVFTYDKKNRVNGRMYRKLRHGKVNGKHQLQYLAKSDSGALFKKNGKYQLYSVEMFDYIFMNAYKSEFISGPMIGGSGGGKNEGYKNKLKTLIFRPGVKVKGIPFISGKTEIFSRDMRQFYNYQFARGKYLDTIPVYRFKVTRKPSTAPGDVIINEMTTIFDTRTFQILGRYIDLKFNNMFVSFNVQMNIELNSINDQIVPAKISYQGNWDIPFKKEERASFLILQKGYTNN